MDLVDARIANTPDATQRQFWELRRTDTKAMRDALQTRLDDQAQPAADTADAASDALADKIKILQDASDKALAFQTSLYDKVDDDTLLWKMLRLEAVADEWNRCPAIEQEKRCAALQLTVVSAGAEMKASQNYWSTGESNGGGSVAAYLLYDPKNGAVLDGGSESKFIKDQKE